MSRPKPRLENAAVDALKWARRAVLFAPLLKRLQKKRENMRLEPCDQRHLDAAQGYIALGMPLDANDELDQIHAFCRCLPEVLAVRLGVYQSAKNWELAHAVAKRLVAEDPENPQWPISLAYAVRRLESLEAAKVILLAAAAKHPEEPIIHYNLGCYECQLGHPESAKEHLRRAFTLEPKCRSMALDDSDLEALWDSLKP